MKKLSEIYQALITQNRYAKIEQMPCAVNASWEADDYFYQVFVLMTQGSQK
jgi:hypothetical protein